MIGQFSLSFSLIQYLNPASLKDPSIHDAEDYRILETSMDKVGLSPAEKADLFRITAAVLHLGNICFEENHKDKKGKLTCTVHACTKLYVVLVISVNVTNVTLQAALYRSSFQPILAFCENIASKI